MSFTDIGCNIRKKARSILRSLEPRPEICYDIRDPARENGWRHNVVHESLLDFVEKFLEQDNYSRQDFSHNQSSYIRPQTLVKIPRARVRDWIGLVFLPDGRVCFETNWWDRYIFENSAYRERFRRVQKINGNVFTLLGVWSGEYYHWFHDILPRLWNSLPHLPAGCRFLINSNAKPYQLEALAALGIGEDRLISQGERIDSVIEHLWFSTPHGFSTFGGTKVMQEVAMRISAKMALTAESGPRKARVYISRAMASHRRVENELQIIPILEKHGFQVLQLERLPFREQIRAVSACDIVLGPHGGGLTNMVFAPDTAHIMEICGPDHLDCYGFLARSSGRPFSRFVAIQKNNRDGDYYVHPEKLDEFLNGL